MIFLRPREGCLQPECVIVTPTRELAIQVFYLQIVAIPFVSTFHLQIFDEARKFSFGSPLRAAIAYGGECSSVKNIWQTNIWISNILEKNI